MDPELYAIFIRDFRGLADSIEGFAKKWGHVADSDIENLFTPEQRAECQEIAERLEAVSDDI